MGISTFPRAMMWYSFHSSPFSILANDHQAGQVGSYEMLHCGDPLTAA